jgi:hypothetical protein
MAGGMLIYLCGLILHLHTKSPEKFNDICNMENNTEDTSFCTILFLYQFHHLLLSKSVHISQMGVKPLSKAKVFALSSLSNIKESGSQS